MNGGTKTQTTNSTQTSTPWDPAQPALQQILAGAGAAYTANNLAPVYSGQRVAGLGSDTLAGLGQMKSGAAAGAGTAASGNDWLNGLLQSGGATAATQGATAGLAGINPNVDTSGVATSAARLSDPNSLARSTGSALAGGAYNTDTSGLAGLAGDFASGGTQTQRSLQDVADGKYLGGANPYLDDIIGRSANDAASKVSQQFAASGRYGSGRFSGAVADAVAGVGTQARYTDYENERGRQASAAAAIDAARNANASTTAGLFSTLSGINQGNAGLATTGANLSLTADQAGLAGESALAALRGNNTDRALGQAGTLLSAAQGDRAAGLAGIAALPTTQAALQQPGQTLAQVGAIQDAARQDEINADMQTYDERANAAWKQLGNYAGLATAIGGMGGTTTGTQVQKVPQASLLQQLFGMGLAGASVASKFMGVP
jgi:hypothetical protein